MVPVESVKSRELMDLILENLNSQDTLSSESALGELERLTLPKGSAHALPIIRRILDLLESEVLTVSPLVVSALGPVCGGLENPEIMECMHRVWTWRTDRHLILRCLIRGLTPTDDAAKYIISRIRLMRPLRDPDNMETINLITAKFHSHFTPGQIDEFLAYLLTPEALNAPAEPDSTRDYELDPEDEVESPAYAVFLAVSNLLPHLSSANWKTIGNCFFQLNYTPVEIVPLVYYNQSPREVDATALILACYEVASDFRSTNGASYEALEVLMSTQTEMDGRLLAKIATLIVGNLGKDLANDVDLDDYVCFRDYLRVRDGSVALVNEVLRLQTGNLWNAPLLSGLFEPFGVGREIGFAEATEVLRALMKFPEWPGELLRQFTSEIILTVFESFLSFPQHRRDAKAFWERFCLEYPAPQMGLLDAFSGLVEDGSLSDEKFGVYYLDGLETIIRSRAYETANPEPDAFWQRLGPSIEPFLELYGPEIRSRACALQGMPLE